MQTDEEAVGVLALSGFLFSFFLLTEKMKKKNIHEYLEKSKRQKLKMNKVFDLQNFNLLSNYK